MSQLYIVYHATRNDANTFFYSEKEALDQIEKNIRKDRENMRLKKEKKKEKGKGKGKGIENEKEKEKEEEVNAWNYRIVTEGVPFTAMLNDDDGDVLRTFLDEECLLANYTRDKLSHPCHIELIAHHVGLTAVDVEEQIGLHKAKKNRPSTLRLFRDNRNNEILDDLQAFSSLHAMTFYLCAVNDKTSVLYSLINVNRQQQSTRSLILLREGYKYSILRPILHGVVNDSQIKDT